MHRDDFEFKLELFDSEGGAKATNWTAGFASAWALYGHLMNVITLGVPLSPMAPLVGGPMVVLFLHGFPEIWYLWRHQMVVVANAGYKAIAPDYRGYRNSDQGPEHEKTTYIDIATDIHLYFGHTEGTTPAKGTAPASNQAKKLVISDEYYQRVTQALVMRLRRHEETVMHDGIVVVTP